MSYPIQVTFRGIPDSESLKRQILAEAEQLAHFFDGILGCSVLFESPHRHHHKGKRYRTRIILTVAGRELVVGRHSAASPEHEDAHVAIRDAFDEARRQLRDYVMRRRGRVKRHETREGLVAAG